MEIKLFQMAFREEWIETVLIPTMNGHLRNKMTLGEFYKWLGCNFFMACFQGITDRESGGRQGLCRFMRVHRFAWEV